MSLAFWSLLVRAVRLGNEDACIESMNIQPTSGGLAPLYSPLNPSLPTVVKRQSSGPLNLADVEVCMRTLTVSNLHLGQLEQTGGI